MTYFKNYASHRDREYCSISLVDSTMSTEITEKDKCFNLKKLPSNNQLFFHVMFAKIMSICVTKTVSAGERLRQKNELHRLHVFNREQHIGIDDLRSSRSTIAYKRNAHGAVVFASSRPASGALAIQRNNIERASAIVPGEKVSHSTNRLVKNRKIGIA